jgi:predicted dehydrogenase
MHGASTPGGADDHLEFAEAAETIDGNFIASVLEGTPLCCPADGALETVRLLEAITRSAATGQVVRLA